MLIFFCFVLFCFVLCLLCFVSIVLRVTFCCRFVLDGFFENALKFQQKYQYNCNLVPVDDSAAKEIDWKDSKFISERNVVKLLREIEELIKWLKVNPHKIDCVIFDIDKYLLHTSKDKDTANGKDDVKVEAIDTGKYERSVTQIDELINWMDNYQPPQREEFKIDVLTPHQLSLFAEALELVVTKGNFEEHAKNIVQSSKLHQNNDSGSHTFREFADWDWSSFCAKDVTIRINSNSINTTENGPLTVSTAVSSHVQENTHDNVDSCGILEEKEQNPKQLGYENDTAHDNSGHTGDEMHSLVDSVQSGSNNVKWNNQGGKLIADDGYHCRGNNDNNINVNDGENYDDDESGIVGLDKMVAKDTNNNNNNNKDKEPELDIECGDGSIVTVELKYAKKLGYFNNLNQSDGSGREITAKGIDGESLKRIMNFMKLTDDELEKYWMDAAWDNDFMKLYEDACYVDSPELRHHIAKTLKRAIWKDCKLELTTSYISGTNKIDVEAFVAVVEWVIDLRLKLLKFAADSLKQKHVKCLGIASCCKHLEQKIREQLLDYLHCTRVESFDLEANTSSFLSFKDEVGLMLYRVETTPSADFPERIYEQLYYENVVNGYIKDVGTGGKNAVHIILTEVTMEQCERIDVLVETACARANAQLIELKKKQLGYGPRMKLCILDERMYESHVHLWKDYPIAVDKAAQRSSLSDISAAILELHPKGKSISITPSPRKARSVGTPASTEQKSVIQ